MQESKICVKCASPFTGRYCKVCDNARSKAYRENNLEKFKIYSASYYAENKEKFRKHNVEYYIKNEEAIVARTKEWKAKNLEKSRNYDAKYRENNKEKETLRHIKYRIENPQTLSASRKNWALRNPWHQKIRTQNKRAKIKASGQFLSSSLTEKLLKLQKGMCPCCRLPLGNDFHMDHIMPLALGGANVDSNIQLLRAKCNLQKGSKHPVDFMQSRGFLL